MQPSLYSSEDTYTETDNRPPSPQFTRSVHVKVKHTGGPVAARKRRIVKEAENLYLRAQTAQRKHDIVACLDVAVAAALEGDLCHYVPEGGGEVKEILGLLVENALKRTRRLGKSDDALKVLKRVASGRYPVALSESFLDAGMGTCWNHMLRLKAQRLDKWKLREEVQRVADCALAMRRVQADSGLSVVSSTEDGPGASGDSHVFGYLFLRCMGRAGYVKEALEMLKEVLRGLSQRGRTSNLTHLYNAVLSACQTSDEVRSLGTATKLIDQLVASPGSSPGVSSFNLAIGSCALGRRWRAAKRLYKRMQSLGLQPDSYTFTALLHACAGKTTVGAKKQFHQRRPVEGPASRSFELRETREGVEFAMEILEVEMPRQKVPPSSFHLTSVLKACAQLKLLVNPRREWARGWPGEGLIPRLKKLPEETNIRLANGTSVSSTDLSFHLFERLRELVERGAGEGGAHRADGSSLLVAITPDLPLLDEREKGVSVKDLTDMKVPCGWSTNEPSRMHDPSSFFARSSELRDSQWASTALLVSALERQKVPLTRDMFNVLLAKCAEAAKWAKAREFIEEMKRRGGETSPDELSFTWLLRSFAKAGRVPEAWGVLREMEEAGLKPTVLTFTSLFHAVASAVQLGRDVDLSLNAGRGVCENVSAMEVGNQPGAVGKEAVVDEKGREGRDGLLAESVSEKKNGGERGGTMGVVASVVDSVDMIMSEMRERNVAPDIVCLNAAMEARRCLGGGKKGVTALFAEILERDLLPESATYSVLLNTLWREGRSGVRVNSEEWSLIAESMHEDRSRVDSFAFALLFRVLLESREFELLLSVWDRLVREERSERWLGRRSMRYALIACKELGEREGYSREHAMGLKGKVLVGAFRLGLIDSRRENPDAGVRADAEAVWREAVLAVGQGRLYDEMEILLDLRMQRGLGEEEMRPELAEDAHERALDFLFNALIANSNGEGGDVADMIALETVLFILEKRGLMPAPFVSEDWGASRSPVFEAHVDASGGWSALACFFAVKGALFRLRGPVWAVVNGWGVGSSHSLDVRASVTLSSGSSAEEMQKETVAEMPLRYLLSDYLSPSLRSCVEVRQGADEQWHRILFLDPMSVLAHAEPPWHPVEEPDFRDTWRGPWDVDEFGQEERAEKVPSLRLMNG
uniref:Pentacotripeptide-repeat region of PRORP domain-containing protein n=1 Tax=Chromera velia CCMP2878 TaxID=1169474 RepID=A0A0G4HS79_9ALVE|eukprot:Cvel_8227.t1-p1 / transcript=Cvel_8227.t1 / gene=Cvel_8227 / organism=Chromera_velia_CCMP2878 / gene_product=Pentatricopeptide repeat-containing protein, putative / transcript_product=Pentatricopeptide repeat-containing protein, putative / location=Cvel_scaffold449:43786-47247(+) / protein_length=1154 / sequence_SO=supercontig / SO=protein_coding / is_pseudo=false